MRKIGLSLFSCIALVAFMGLSAPAFAVTDPDCDGSPYNNDPVIHEFNIATTRSGEHQVSGLTGGGLACGTNISWPNGGGDSIYDHADIRVPPGVEVNNTSGIANGRFVGVADVNIASQIPYISSVIYEHVVSTMVIASIAECEDQNPVGGDIPGTIIACYRGFNSLGHNYNWTTAGNDGNTWLTIGPFHPLAGTAGLTRIHQFSLCGYAGAQGGTVYPDDCGTDSDPFLQKNGDAPPQVFTDRRRCPTDAGIYTVTATQIGGTTTPPATTCVQWLPVKPIPS